MIKNCENQFFIGPDVEGRNLDPRGSDVEHEDHRHRRQEVLRDDTGKAVRDPLQSTATLQTAKQDSDFDAKTAPQDGHLCKYKRLYLKK